MVSGGTRSALSRICRDIFASVKRTYRKLGIFFWDYLHDRGSHPNEIPPLAAASELVCATLLVSPISRAESPFP